MTLRGLTVTDVERRHKLLNELDTLFASHDSSASAVEGLDKFSDQAYAICRAVDSPACKILYDMYHMQRNEGDIIQHIDLAWSEIAYFQIGDNPGRKEPGTGEMNYKNVFSHIAGRGYTGVFGMEHGNSKPGKEGEQALIDAYVAADSF